MRLLILVLLHSFYPGSTPRVFADDDSFISQAANAAESVDQMRRALVKAVPVKVTAETFKAVCKPVGMHAKAIAAKKKWLFRQTSNKNRNKQNAANKLEQKALAKFENNANLYSLWWKEKGRNHYFRRIVVQKQCLACHGNKAARPGFVRKKYPHDRAFGFKAGDLRGVYHIADRL